MTRPGCREVRTGGDDVVRPTGQMSRGVAAWSRLGLVLGGVGVALWVARILTQGDVVMWTDIARGFWVPDPTLGWIETRERWVWLGLEGLGVAAGVVIGASALAWLARRWGAGQGHGRLAATLGTLALVGAGVSAAAPVLPVWAFVSGLPPAGAERLLPSAPPPAAAPAVVKAEEPLPVPAGRWVVASSTHNLLVARVTAGGETFDARFAPVSGEVTLEPAALARSRARLEVPAGSIDTGIDLRNGHARGYLGAEQHPTIALSIEGLDAVEGGGAARTFNARGMLGIMGRRLEVPVTGTLTALDETASAALGVTGGPALLVSAGFSVAVTAVGLDRDNFDADAITLTGRFVLVREGTAREGTL